MTARSEQSANARRVLILTAEVGDGHLSAARTLAADIASHEPGCEVVIADALEGLGPVLRFMLLDSYRWQLRWAPWIFGCLYAVFGRFAPLRGVGRAGLALLGSRSMRRLMLRHDADVVVSTYPAAASVLGSLRRRGLLSLPVYATVTDLGGLAFWAHPGVDLHLVMHEACVTEVERLAGPGSARRVRPLVDATFFQPCDAGPIRSRLGVTGDQVLVIVSGGGWGVGDLAGAAETALTRADAFVVCLAGRDEQLRRRLEQRFAGEQRVLVLGFTDEMNELLSAADVLVHSTGGVTSLEALVRGCPVIAYGSPPGHAPLLSRTIAALGLGEDARSPAELKASLQRIHVRQQRGPSLLDPAPPAALLIVAAGANELRTRSDSGRKRIAAVAALLAALLLGGWTLASDDGYRVWASPVQRTGSQWICASNHSYQARTAGCARV